MILAAETVDIMTVAVPETHFWAVFLGWIGSYIAGRWIGGAR